MGNNYCKQLEISPLHPISKQDFIDLWNCYVDSEGDHLGALTPAVAKRFIFDFAEAIGIVDVTDEKATRLIADAIAASEPKRSDGRVSREAFLKLFFYFSQAPIASGGHAMLTESLADALVSGGQSLSIKLRFLFFNVPLHGHVNPSLDLVHELVQRGHHVTYYTGENFREKIVHSGAEFRAYPSDIEFKTTRSITNIFNTGKEMIQAAEKIMKHICPSEDEEEKGVTQPEGDSSTSSSSSSTSSNSPSNLKGCRITKGEYDVILYDVSAIWGKFLGYVLDIPSVCCFPGLAPQWRSYIKSGTVIKRGIADRIEGGDYLQESADIMSKISETYSVPNFMINKMFSGSSLLNVVFTSAFFQPYSSEMDKTFIFVGPSLHTRLETVEFPWDQVDKNKKLVYISMGTLYKQDPAFFKICFDAFKNESEKDKYQVIISVGKGTDLESLQPIPSNFIVRNYVPQPNILERTDVFISHAGMGGISEAMHFSVPMLLLPKTIEQQLNARRINELGAGIDLRSQDATASQLLAGTEKLLSDDSYRTNAKKIGDSFESTGGVGLAVDAILEVPQFYVKRKATSMTSRIKHINSSILKTFGELGSGFFALDSATPLSPVTSPRSRTISENPTPPRA